MDSSGIGAGFRAHCRPAASTESGPKLQQWNRPDWWPIGSISADAPRLLLLRGTADPIVSVELVADVMERMREAGAADIEYIRVEGGDHNVAYNRNLDVTKPAMDSLLRANPQGWCGRLNRPSINANRGWGR